ncbi:PREDICTED: protein HHL1, chloroplastic [Prunus mume]|uniref:Protein HHL1, chloroplastic n=1 Tax=Prunus mume TaxID=102107 RepID=A0ABM0NAS7_PRUMU|nr:PREDICTED: protein HHL1, chloroplastic [Prunus mume]
MEAGMSLNAVVRLPLSSSRTHEDGLVRHSLVSTTTTTTQKAEQRQGRKLVVQAKSKRGMMARQFQAKKPPPPAMPKIEDDGNPRFVVFMRMANVYLWYPLSVISGGTTAKIMVAAKDNFLGKYIYKDTLARNLAAVIYRDEKEIQKTAFKQYRVLRSATDFRYGYKIVENGNMRAALSTSDVIELPTKDKLKTTFDKVKDFFGDAKESFGKLTTLNLSESQESEEKSAEQEKVKG